MRSFNCFNCAHRAHLALGFVILHLRRVLLHILSDVVERCMCDSDTGEEMGLGGIFVVGVGRIVVLLVRLVAALTELLK